MKSACIIAVALAAMAAGATHAQGNTKVFRCPGNSYTNSETEAKANGCKPMDGGSFTIVEGTRVNGAAPAPGSTRVATTEQRQRVDVNEQRQRDSDARAVLENELRKAENRRDELAKEFNNGEPEMLGPEHRNHQKYLDRIAELKASIARNENDIAGIKRELARAGGGSVQ